MNMAGLLEQLFIFFTIALLGWGAVRYGILPKDTNRVLSALVINITNPCTVLASVMNGQRVLSAGEVWTLTAVAVGLHLMLMLLGLGLTRALAIAPEKRKVYQYMAVFGNTGFLGFPVMTALFGQEALFPAAIFVLVFQLFCYTYGAGLFSREGFQWRNLISPMILATLAAFVLYLLNVDTPPILGKLTGTIGSITSPAAMLALGCTLGALPVRSLTGQWKTALFSLVRLTVAPVIVFLLCRPWMDNALMLGVTVTVVAMPVAVNTTLMAAKYQQDQDTAAAGVMISTLLSMGTLPLILGILF